MLQEELKYCKLFQRNAIPCKNWSYLKSVISMCRFHELAKFDEAKRSCRKRLARHNERRRKSCTGTCNEGSSIAAINGQQHPLDQSHCANDNVVDWRNIQMNMPISSSHKFFKFRWIHCECSLSSVIGSLPAIRHIIKTLLIKWWCGVLSFTMQTW